MSNGEDGDEEAFESDLLNMVAVHERRDRYTPHQVFHPNDVSMRLCLTFWPLHALLSMAVVKAVHACAA